MSPRHSPQLELQGIALRSGVSGLVIAFARQLAKLFGRKKLKVWPERFHSREASSHGRPRSLTRGS